jgi:hypothetical protein
MRAQNTPSRQPRQAVPAGRLAKALVLCLPLSGLAPAIVQAAWTAPQGAPAGKISFFLQDPASAGGGLLGHGTFTYQGHDYAFEARGERLSRTSADAPPNLVGSIYNVRSIADLGGDYVSVGDPAAGLHYIQNGKGVVAELGNGTGGGKLKSRDQSNPITITLTGAAAP